MSNVIVILGGGLASGTAKIGRASRLRADAGAALYKKHPHSRIIVSGGTTARGARYSEAEEMRDYLVTALHIPAADIRAESASLSTPENVRNVAKIVQSMSAKPSAIFLIAGRRNRLLAAEYFRAAGVVVRPKTVRQVLGASLVPRMFERRLTEIDRKQLRFARLVRWIDPRGRLLAWWLRRKRK